MENKDVYMVNRELKKLNFSRIGGFICLIISFFNFGLFVFSIFLSFDLYRESHERLHITRVVELGYVLVIINVLLSILMILFYIFNSKSVKKILSWCEENEK